MASIQADMPFHLVGGTVDDKQNFKTKAEMKACPEDDLGKTAMATCDEDGILYVYNKNNEVDSVYGKWRSLISIITENLTIDTSNIDGGEFPIVTVDVTGVTLNYSTYSLEPGKTIQLAAFITPDNATDTTITWSSDNSNATVSDTGLVTANTVGTSIITAKTSKDGINATCTITIEITNLFDKTDTYVDKYIDAIGNLTADSIAGINRTYSKHYSVTPGQNVRIDMPTDLYTYYSMTVTSYAADGTFIERNKKSMISYMNTTIPENASYILVGFGCSNVNYKEQVIANWDNLINGVTLKIR